MAQTVQGSGAARGIVEIIVASGMTSLVELKDGSVMMLLPSKKASQVSRDLGKTWDEPKPLVCDGKQLAAVVTESTHSIIGVTSLQSGKLALTYFTQEALFMATSADEGQTWSTIGEIGRTADGTPYHDVMIQLKNGRLLLPARWCASGEHPDNYQPRATGRWKGTTVALEGHGHSPEIDIAFAYYSDDEGKTWQKCKGHLMGWFQSGALGVTPCDEPCVAETKDGRVLFFARSTVGRIVSSYSEDGGVTWSKVKPTDLANSYSPARLVSIPKTGDLLCVWNQVSGEDIRRGFRRGRLSLAISETNGQSWKNFKTIEVSDGLDPDATMIEADGLSTSMVRAHADCGEMPDGWRFFHYPNADFAAGHVFITYLRGQLVEDASAVRHVGQPQEEVLRVFPVEWLYEE